MVISLSRSAIDSLYTGLLVAHVHFVHFTFCYLCCPFITVATVLLSDDYMYMLTVWTERVACGRLRFLRRCQIDAK